jgi:hypothetical protein
VIPMMCCSGTSANLKWRLLTGGFALPVTAYKLVDYQSASAVVPPFFAVSTAVRALGALSPGNITAWHHGSSPR